MRRRVLGVLALFALAMGCNGILGWDAATLDPEAGTSSACENYCTAMDANCTGTNLKYLSHDVCLKMCSHFDPGAPGDVSGDSQTCRLNFARAATAEAAANCEAASPLGTGPCTEADGGTIERCKAFCLLDLDYCVGDDAGNPPPYTTPGDCTTACALYPYTPQTRVSDDQSQNTLNCRLYHLEAAYVDDTARGTHCPHTKQASFTCTN